MKIMVAVVIAFLSGGVPSVLYAQIKSEYTSISSTSCTDGDPEGIIGGGILDCPGIADYKLNVFNGGETITVVKSRNQEHTLKFQDAIGHEYSGANNTVEWRVKRVAGVSKPIALIFKATANESSREATSYFVVAKIMSKVTCITDKVEANPNGHTTARHLADDPVEKECLSEVVH